jgi:hypothetical protein
VAGPEGMREIDNVHDRAKIFGNGGFEPDGAAL